MTRDTFAICSDPTTPSETLVATLRQWPSPQVRSAIHANPALPADDLILAVYRGSTDALRNPSLPLALLNGGTYEVDQLHHMAEGEATPTVAVERCLWLHIAGAVRYAPRSFLDDLRAWVFTAILGAARWWSDSWYLLADLKFEEQWRSIECDRGDDLGERSGNYVEMCCLWLLGRDIDTAFMLSLFERLLTCDLPDDAAPHVAAVRHAAALLGHEVRRPATDARQISLFDEVAA